MQLPFSPRALILPLVVAAVLLLAPDAAFASAEAELVLPDLDNPAQKFFGMTGKTLLTMGLVIAALGIVFGLVIYVQLKKLPVHRSMLEVSDLIYETCKTYLLNQGKFILILWVFIAAVMVFYFGFLRAEHAEPAGQVTAAVGAAEGAAKEGVTTVAPTGHELKHYSTAFQVTLILFFSVVGIAGSYAVAWFGMRVNTFANSRTAFAALQGLARPVYAIPLKSGMSIGMVLISVELLIMLIILLFVPRNLAGPCFIGFAIGESLGAAALRVAGGIFTKIADIGADLMKIVFKIKEDDARNPGVIADCVGDNAGDSVGPTADGFETYGVTGVALITFILLAVGVGTGMSDAQQATIQIQLLVWIFVMRLLMVVTSGLSYFIS